VVLNFEHDHSMLAW